MFRSRRRAERPRRSILLRIERIEAIALLSALLIVPAHGSVAVERNSTHADAPRLLRDITYTDATTPAAKLDLYLPSAPSPPGGRPVVIAIHGGGWRRFSKDSYGAKVAPAFTQAGFAVVAPNYRLSAPGSPSWPANFQQIRQAVRWTRDHAAEFGLDPDRIAAMGESAGGHLAALLGTDPGSADSRVAAVVDFYGPTDLATLAAVSPAAAAAEAQMLGGPPEALPDLYRAASPITHVSRDSAPTLIIQGTADTLVKPDQSRRLADALTAAGVTNRLILLPGAPHGIPRNYAGRDLFAESVRFLKQVFAPRIVASTTP